MSRTALAFMSYVNVDDQHESGRLTQLRERLSGEVRIQTGAPFDIFQDRKDIAWGQQWQERINQSLDAVTFLIPIITPAFFRSDACRDELERFLKREKELGRGDLILPVYYVRCPALQDKAKREHDKLAQCIAARQYADWRKLRFEPLDTPLVRKALAKMAEQIVVALERQQEKPPGPLPEKESKEKGSAANTFNVSGGTQSIAQGANPIGTQINNYYNEQPIESVKEEPVSTQSEQNCTECSSTNGTNPIETQVNTSSASEQPIESVKEEPVSTQSEQNCTECSSTNGTNPIETHSAATQPTEAVTIHIIKCCKSVIAEVSNVVEVVKFIFSSTIFCAIIVAALLIASYYFAPSKKPASSTRFVSVVNDGVNMRSDATTNSEVRFKMPANYPLELISGIGDEWVRVRDYEGEEGWIAASLVSDVPYVIVTELKGNIRSGPGPEYDVIGNVVRDVILKKLEEKEDWIKVSHPKITGWIAKQLVWP